MSDSHIPHDPYAERRRYMAESGAGTWVLGGILTLFVVFGLMFALTSRVGPEQTASNIERPAIPLPGAADATVPPGQSRAVETTGSGAQR